MKPQFKDVNPDDPIGHVVSLNLLRRQLSPSQKALAAGHATKLREKLGEQAKERHNDGVSRGGRSSGVTRRGETKSEANLPQTSRAPQARDEIGKMFGISGRSVSNGILVTEKGTPELIAAVEANQVAVSSAARVATFAPIDCVSPPKLRAVYEAARKLARIRTRLTLW